MSIIFKQINKQKVEIYLKGKLIGHLFTPSGSGENCLNAIQVCGFTEAFDYWGCGNYSGTKDIQLLYEEAKPKNEYGSVLDRAQCYACYCNPCQCEDRSKGKERNPFIVKRESMLKDRLKYKDDKTPTPAEEIDKKYGQRG